MHQYMDVVRFGLVRLNYNLSYIYPNVMLSAAAVAHVHECCSHTAKGSGVWSNKRCQTLSNQQKKSKNSWIRNFSDGIRFTTDCCCLNSLFKFAAIEKKQISSQLSRFRWRILCNYFLCAYKLFDKYQFICLFVHRLWPLKISMNETPYSDY